MSSAHLSAARLVDYWLGDSAVEGFNELEEHLFECTDCSATLEAMHRTGASIVAAVRAGALGSGATTALVNRMSRDRLHMRHYTIAPGETVACSVSVDDDFMVGHFVLPPGEHARLDMRVLDAGHHELMRVDDIVIDTRHRQAIIFIPARPVLSEDSAITHYVLVAPGTDGDRDIGTYSMDHTALRDG